MRRLPLRSPPRMRGKGTSAVLFEHPVGITPACAGKRFPGFAESVFRWDHPRVCGEKALSTFSSRKNSGSPPRVRGKGLERFEPLRCVGITPAYAGKSSTATRAARSTGDHPRICGEKPSSNCCLLITSGSPPRMRGKVCSAVDDECQPGITPACAGKSQGYQCHTSGYKDHPHVCGEKLPGCAVTLAGTGSPPRMRGKDAGCLVHYEKHRITPAYAEKRTPQHTPRSATWDHPRVCGEKFATWQ